MFRSISDWIRWMLRLCMRTVKREREFRFDEYVSHWRKVAKNPSALDVSPECIQSNEWVMLAQRQYEILRWAGLRKDWTIIEIGCANGKIPYMLKREEAIPDGRYYGLDIAEECIETCRTWFSSTNFHFEVIRNNILNFEDNFADCVFLMSVFTHVDEDTIRSYLKQIRRILKQDGVCIFTIHLPPRGGSGRVTIPIAQYPVERITKIIRDLEFFPYRFARHDPPDHETYLPGVVPGQTWGLQFFFIVSKEEVSNPKLVPIHTPLTPPAAL